MKTVTLPANDLQQCLCYSLVAEAMEQVEANLRSVKAVRFLAKHSWAHGKRLRPIIFLLANLSLRAADNASTAIGAREAKLACAIELLHEASLIHDDLVDRSNLRRGKPTLQMTHGEGLSLLIGDYLIFTGLKLVLDAAATNEDIILAKELASAGLDVAHGEAEQLDRYLNQDDPVNRMSLDNYLGIIAKKTAAFFAGCAEAGAALGGGDVKIRENYRAFGMNLGLVFQMMDDLLDLLGDEQVAKKTLKNNINEGTITLPIIHAWRLDPQHNLLTKLANKKPINGKEAQIIYHLLAAPQVIAACKTTLQEYIEQTNNYLALMPKNIYSLGLADLFEYIKICSWAGMKW